MEKYAHNSVAGTDTSKLFHIPLNRLKNWNTCSQFSFRCVLGIRVNPVTISLPLLVALTIIIQKGNIQVAARRINNMYNMPFLILYPIS